MTTGDSLETHELLGAYFGRYNARSSLATHVAQHFVSSHHYWELAQPTNHVLLGPRGSGKTTLLKMLQPEALGAWDDDPGAAKARDIVDYSAVLVPTDRSWGYQLTGLSESLDPQWQAVLKLNAFTITVLKEFVDTALRRLGRLESETVHLPVTMPRSGEERLAREMGEAFGLAKPVASLSMLKSALNGELVRMYRVVAQYRATSDESVLAGLPGHGLELDATIVHFIELFNDLAGDHDRRWALMIDELELAASVIVNRVERMMRGTSPLLIVKLSLAPYTETRTAFNEPLSGMAGHDYTPIMLTYAARGHADEFSRALMQRQASQMGADIATVLGPSAFDAALDAEAEEPAPTSTSRYSAKTIYSRLSSRDHTFAAYLAEKGIDLDRLDALTRDERAAWLRKPRSVVAVREFYGFRRDLRRRSRKTATLYTGTTAIVALLEGNARWLKGLTDKLLEAYAQQDEPGAPLDAAVQAQLVHRASEAFLNYLRMIPHPGSGDTAALWSPIRLLERIATYISSGVITDPFRPDPPLSFYATDDLHPDVVSSLRLLIHAGAVIHVPRETHETVLGDLTGKRFRLAYLVAPTFPIPLRLGKEISLAAILGDNDPSQLALDETGNAG